MPKEITDNSPGLIHPFPLESPKRHPGALPLVYTVPASPAGQRSAVSVTPSPSASAGTVVSTAAHAASPAQPLSSQSTKVLPLLSNLSLQLVSGSSHRGPAMFPISLPTSPRQSLSVQSEAPSPSLSRASAHNVSTTGISSATHAASAAQSASAQSRPPSLTSSMPLAQLTSCAINTPEAAVVSSCLTPLITQLSITVALWQS